MNETATPADRIARSGQDLPVSGFLAPRKMRGMDGAPWGGRPAGTCSGNDDTILEMKTNGVKIRIGAPWWIRTTDPRHVKAMPYRWAKGARTPVAFCFCALGRHSDLGA